MANEHKILNFILLDCTKAEIWTPYSEYKNVHQNHLNVTILIIFVSALHMNKLSKSYLPSRFQTLDIEVLSPKIETFIVISINQPSVTIFINCVYTC